MEKKNMPEVDIEFVSYDISSRYNRCSGVLTVKINDEIVVFGSGYKNTMYEEFWVSGGRCYFSNNYADANVEKGPWELSCNTEDYKPLMDKYGEDILEKILEIMNENVSWGCCGGCL